ncbi:hypothetical protein OE88DRAFT_1661108 [Heliocybe sulcata]|uniref:F-box domain-containing protein n=1 Tax=Heliocybe sulcata TaxID=5364 RepID=A0A5C3N0B0_9AGAM|nr:hypothetical protein OE88DRAFT_1661108 [Heliocybe sulcata]
MAVSPFDADDVVLAARRELEQQIIVHEMSLIQIRIRLNTLVLIARLPPEVLAEIFAAYICAHGQPEVPIRLSSGPHQPYAWLVITHVCHHWRTVALGTPSLWTEVYLTQPECVQMMLTRSKQVPLSILLPRNPLRQNHRLTLEHALAQLHRIRRLDLSVSFADLEKLDSARLGDPIQLRELVLARLFHMNEKPSGTLLLPIISRLATARLQSLLIYNLPLIAFRELLMPTLTSLSLSNCSPSIDVMCILKVLQTMPKLRLLHLTSVLASSGLLSRDARYTADLPHLEHVTVSDMPPQCAALLSNLCLSSNAAVTLTLDHYIMLEPSSFSSVLSPIASAIDSTMSSTPLQVLSILQGVYSRIELEGWTRDAPQDSEQKPDRKFVVRISTKASFEGAVETFLNGLHLADVKYLKVQSSIITWRELMCFVNLTRLSVIGVKGLTDRIIGLPRALEVVGGGYTLSTMKSEASAYDPKSIMCPHLESLRLENVKFAASPTRIIPDDFLPVLLRALQSRAACGIKLKHLDIARAENFTASTVQQLKGSVEKLHWDEIENVQMPRFREEDTEDEVEMEYDDDDGDSDYQP